MKYIINLDYYNELLKYCMIPFSKNDIIKLLTIYNFRDKNYFELILIFEFGEKDRIDMKLI